MAAPLLPPAAPGWPAPLRAGPPAAQPASDAVVDALRRIRAETLFWPAPRAGAPAPRALAFGAAGLALARAAHDDAAILRDVDPAGVDPARLEGVYGAAPALTLWAMLGGLATGPGGKGGGDDADGADAPALAALTAAVGVSPWGGGPMTLAEATAAQALLRRAALRARGPVTLIGMSAWKRRCLRPFLTGPDGPPRAARSGAPATGPAALWGDAPGPPDALRIEDGFLRSVGLGLRHTPPLSLAIHAGPPHFDATRPNAFDATVAAADFTPALLARAAALRARLLALRLTKYNLPGAEAPPDAGGRLALLVPGQVAGDASIRLGARAVRDDLALLAAARARFPDAFILYKPHPDALTGLRAGAAAPTQALRWADATVTRASAADCLDWADRVATITSLTGFEALLRGKAATTFGRPFYAGWGLTDDVDPPSRDRRLSLDALTAAALILHADYIDPISGLPATPEAALDALARARDEAGSPAARLRRLWRDVASWTLTRF